MEGENESVCRKYNSMYEKSGDAVLLKQHRDHFIWSLHQGGGMIPRSRSVKESVQEKKLVIKVELL